MHKTTTTCQWCESGVTDPASAYCPVCGGRLTAITGRNPEMVYKSVSLNENGKAIVCPHCENEELTLGSFCKI